MASEESRTALVRAESAYADASQRLVQARREATESQSRAHALQVETLRLTQLAEQTRARSAQLAGDLAEVVAQLEDLQERRVAAEAQFEALDMSLADTQERHAQLDERVLEAERKLSASREQQRSLERQAQEATFSLRTLDARKAELARTMDTATQQTVSVAAEEQRARVRERQRPVHLDEHDLAVGRCDPYGHSLWRRPDQIGRHARSPHLRPRAA